MPCARPECAAQAVLGMNHRGVPQAVALSIDLCFASPPQVCCWLEALTWVLSAQGEQLRRLSKHPALPHLTAAPCTSAASAPAQAAEPAASGTVAAPLHRPLHRPAGSAPGASLRELSGGLQLSACLHLVPGSLRQSAVFKALLQALPDACQHVVLDEGASRISFGTALAQSACGGRIERLHACVHAMGHVHA